jgi:glutamate/tyrosine decarboxylase-like PLP-dependent enzyme
LTIGLAWAQPPQTIHGVLKTNSSGPAAFFKSELMVLTKTDLLPSLAHRPCGIRTRGGRQSYQRRHDGDFIALKLARDWGLGRSRATIRSSPALGVYTSEERHVSVDKAVDAVGLSRTALRALPTDSEFRVRLDALESAIAEDRRHGVVPLCIATRQRRAARSLESENSTNS